MIERYRCCQACDHKDICNRSIVECRRYQADDHEKARKKVIGYYMFPLTMVCLTICFLAFVIGCSVLNEFSFLMFIAWIVTSMFLIFFLLPDRKDSK